MKYRLLIYNIGHGRYNINYKKGDIVNKEQVINNFLGEYSILVKENPDIILLQETGVTKINNYRINYKQYFSSYKKIYIPNRKIPFVMNIGNSIFLREQYDYKYSIIKCNKKLNGYKNNLYCQNKNSIKLIINDLVIYNVHFCPYKANYDVRQHQLINILSDAYLEYKNAKKVIIGGDFNQSINELPEEYNMFKIVFPNDDTCRDLNDINNTFKLDGFIISDNIINYNVYSLKNYLYSDHSPVILEIDI